MDDAEYIFRADSREKKNIAHSAYHRKGGSKSRRCTLPHEKMTKGELKRMSGPVKEWKMDEFYSWSDFKAMPDDLKAEYLNGITDRFDVGLNAVAKYVFGVSISTLIYQLQIRDIDRKVHKGKWGGNGGKAYASKINALKQAVLSKDETKETKPNQPDQERKIAPPEPPYKTIKELSFRMDGFDGLLLDTIRVMVADRPCDIEIKVTMR